MWVIYYYNNLVYAHDVLLIMYIVSYTDFKNNLFNNYIGLRFS